MKAMSPSRLRSSTASSAISSAAIRRKKSRWRKFVANPDWAAMLLDTQAAIDAVKDVGPVGIIGFCLGGSVAYAAATKLSGLSAAIGYYGGDIVRFSDDKQKGPTQITFRGKDAGISASDL